MIEKIKALCRKHREILVYLIVGGLTTLVSWAAKFLFNYFVYGGAAHPDGVQNTILSVVENAAGIAFAYPTNRAWVFQSKNPNLLAEAGSFVGSRLVTMLIGWRDDADRLAAESPACERPRLFRLCRHGRRLGLRRDRQLHHQQVFRLQKELRRSREDLLISYPV